MFTHNSRTKKELCFTELFLFHRVDRNIYIDQAARFVAAVCCVAWLRSALN